MRLIVTFFVILTLSGCENKYQEGYVAGYSDGVLQTENRLKNEYEEKFRNLEDKSSRLSVTSTEVCGGSGINVNNKHYSGGKTGCVRVYSDGRVVRY